LNLEDDAIDAIRTYATRNQISLGAAASLLIRRGACYQLPVRKRNGLPVFEVPDGFPVIATEQVSELLDEE
jgi:hypothetical protein